MFDKGTTLTQYEQDYILLEYPKVGVSARKLSELLGVNTYQIKKFLISQNISIKTISQAKTIYEVDHNYFDEMDSEEKAYFYGWLCADGCNSSDTKGVVIKIQEGDRNLLQKLNDLIQPTRPILFYPRRKPSEKNQVTMIIWSQRITNRLTELGCGPRKTFTLEWPEWMPENLWPAFLRGLNDGDGCISERGSVLITGSTILLKRAAEMIFKSCGVTCHVYPHPSNGVSRLEIGGRRKAVIFLDWLYESATIYLDRKFDKYIIMKSFVPKNRFHLNADGLPLTEEEKKVRTKAASRRCYERQKIKGEESKNLQQEFP